MPFCTANTRLALTTTPSALRRLLCVFLIATALAVQACALQEGEQSPAPRAQDLFVTLNGIRFHYVDWGGRGEVMLFLGPLAGGAHVFDSLAPHFTDRFRVLGLTRRGTEPSAAPASGYDTDTLAKDIETFLDALDIDRAALVGYSIAGDEMTRFAGLHPQRTTQLVYLDATWDRASNRALTKKACAQFPIAEQCGDTQQASISAAILKEAEAADPDYTKVTAPALSLNVSCWQNEASHLPSMRHLIVRRKRHADAGAEQKLDALLTEIESNARSQCRSVRLNTEGATRDSTLGSPAPRPSVRGEGASLGTSVIRLMPTLTAGVCPQPPCCNQRGNAFGPRGCSRRDPERTGRAGARPTPS